MTDLRQSPTCARGNEQDRPWPQDRDLTKQPDEPGVAAGVLLVSADSHLLEPDDWRDRMPSKFRDRAPRSWVDDNGRAQYSYNGRQVSVGLDPCVSEGRPGIGDLDIRMSDLDAEGVSAEVLYPQRSFALIAGMRASHSNLIAEDEEYAKAYVAGYNAYVGEVMRHYPGRLFGPGILNFWDVAGTRDQIQEIKALGLCGLVLPTAPPGLHYNSPDMDPMWTAIEESGLPLSFHAGEKFDAEGPGTFGTSLMMSFHPFRRLWSLLVFSGVLERHPSLRVVFTEGGIHWIPGALVDADHFFSNFRSIMEPRLAHEPSHYWFQNCYATFQDDPVGLAHLDRIGADRILWASDYPHPEGTLGHTRASAQAVIDVAGDEIGRRIVGESTVSVFGLSGVSPT